MFALSCLSRRLERTTIVIATAQHRIPISKKNTIWADDDGGGRGGGKGRGEEGDRGGGGGNEVSANISPNA